MSEEQKQRTATWIYAVIAILAAAVIGLLIWMSSIKKDLTALETEKEMQRADFQAEVDSLMRVHNELKESYGELSMELAEKDSIIKNKQRCILNHGTSNSKKLLLAS